MTTPACDRCEQRPPTWSYNAGLDAPVERLCTPCLRQLRESPVWGGGIVTRYPAEDGDEWQALREVDLDA